MIVLNCQKRSNSDLHRAVEISTAFLFFCQFSPAQFLPIPCQELLSVLLMNSMPHKKLVIVESPSKAKTIGKYLGPEYIVRASVGHVRDLPKSNKDAIDIPGGFIPRYVVSPEKKKVVAELSKLTMDGAEVILATDPDREGEAISWHIADLLSLEHPKRAVFHEITEKAIKEAMAHPREIDQNLVKAQEARRVLDRIVGYDLSGLIWKKVRYGLSAGRVQSPALRILMEREREIRAFKPEDFWVLNATFTTPKKETFQTECVEQPKTEAEANRILEAAKNLSWHVAEVDETKAERKARAPFTTSTLQQAASSRLGIPPSRTMRLAQKLYEAGHISYMRTDSTHLGDEAMANIGAIIEKTYGKNYADLHAYKTKSKNAQEAHEAIRPTHFDVKVAGANDQEKKLYALIWARTVASQMKPAEILRTKISAATSDSSIPLFTANGSRVIFDGWLAADPKARGEDVELPKVTKDEKLSLTDITSEQKQTQPPSRYSEAGLVKELEKRGIGRPSTYASIIQTIETRGYVEKIDRTLKPTDTGEVVSGFLETNFADIISDTFTAEMEENLDEIARGEKEYKKTLSNFYGPFHKLVDSKKDVPKVTDLGAGPAEFPCPDCGAPMHWKLGRSGKFLSCSKYPECEGARMTDGAVMEKPKDTGELCPECGKGNLIERTGRYGSFIACARYPKCKFIKKDPVKEAENLAKASTGITCPKCKEGMIVQRRGRFGFFYSCSNYPKCDFAMNGKPTGAVCDLCGSLMMIGTKTMPIRCSNKGCANHTPGKTKKEK
jgi:DNA topoisomerase-1